MTDPRSESIPSGARSDPREQQELDAVVRLLRSLPDPEPSPQLSERIMVAVRRREARPKVLRIASRAARPAVGAAIAAGLAGFAVLTFVGSSPAARPVPRVALQEMPARPVDDAEPSPSASFPAPALSFTRMSDPLQRSPQSPVSRHLGHDEAVRVDAQEQHLDHLLNSLLLDPQRFYEWLAVNGDHRLAVARLADRAAARGDATDVAMQLRQKAPSHQMTALFRDELFRATVEDYLSKQRR